MSIEAKTTIRRLVPLALATMLAAGCATVPPEQDPVLIKLTNLENRLMKMERVLDNQSLLDLHAQVQQMQAETMELRGVVETLQFEASGASDRQRDQYLDLDNRLARLEQGVAGGRGVTSLAAPYGGTGSGEELDAASGTASGAGAIVAVGDQAAYQVAFGLLKEGRYDESATSFTEFLNAYPESNLRDNAQYWLAESRYVVRKYREALPLFQTVIDQYPQSRKTADALLKIGFCYYELGQYDAARDALRQVTDNHGDTTAARLARQRLDRMRSEGR